MGGHLGAFAVSPDGTRIACNLYPSTTIKLWNTATGAFMAELKGHTDNVTALSFSPNSQTLASGSRSGDASIKLWSLMSREATATLNGHTDTVSGLAFSPDGKRLASGSRDKTVKLWNVAAAQEQTTLRGHDAGVYAMAFAPDGHTLATGARSSSSTMILWKADSGEQIKTLPAFESVSLAFSANGQQIYHGGTGGRLSAWDVATGKKIGQATDLGTSYLLNTLSLNPNGKSLLVSAGTAVREIDLATLKLNRLGTGHQASLTSVAISPDSRWIASAAFDGQGVNVWNTVTGETKTQPANAKSDVFALAFSPDGRTIATGGGASRGLDSVVQLWDTTTGREMHAIPTRGSVDSLAFSPSGQTLAWSDLSTLIRLWDVATQRETTALKGHEDSAKDFAWTRDGKVMVSVDRKGIARIWNVASGQSSAITIGPHGLASVAMSPDGSRFATAVDSRTTGLAFVQMWDAADKKELATFKKIPILADLGHHALAFSPDGRQLAVVAGGVASVRLCDVDTGRVIRTIALNRLDVEGGATCVAFDATGRYLITGNNNGTVYVLRLAGPPKETAVASRSPVNKVETIPPPPLAVAPFDAAQAKAHQAAWAKYLGTTVETTNSVGAKMILIPPGEFLMGSTDEQIEAAWEVAAMRNPPQGYKERIQEERPQHRVVVAKPFQMGATEVTIGQFKRFVEATKYLTEAEQYGFGDSADRIVSDRITTEQNNGTGEPPATK